MPLFLRFKVCLAGKPAIIEVPWARSHEEALVVVDTFHQYMFCCLYFSLSADLVLGSKYLSTSATFVG